MGNPFEEPFTRQKQRKPGVADLVGDVFGGTAKAALEKKLKKEKKKPMGPQEDVGGDIVMSSVEREKMREEAEHVRLHDVPTFTRFPDADAIKKEFTFDWIDGGYGKDLPIAYFTVTDDDLEGIGLDKQLRKRILQALEASEASTRLAKVFDIGNIIKQRQQADPEYPDSLTTKEVFEAIDAAGYRPATLRELLAYGRDYWKPDEAGFGSYNSALFSIGSAFGTSGISSPMISIDDGGKRGLTGRRFENRWRADQRFLVVRA